MFEEMEMVDILIDLGKMFVVILNDVLDLLKIEVGKFDFLFVDGDFCYVFNWVYKLFLVSVEEK